MIRKILFSVALFSFLTACTHTPGGIAASNIPLAPNSYTVLENVEGSDCAYAILGIIPVTDGNELEDVGGSQIRRISMIPVIVKLCESPSRAGGLLIRNYR
jgi:hypothetical protein